MVETVFSKIVRGEVPCHKIWEDDKHLAFLSIFPNTPGFSVVIPKEHQPSYVAEAEDRVICELMVAAKKVAKKLDAAFEDVGRTGMIFEGFGVDHLHVKLFPMHGTADMSTWKAINSDQKKFFEHYEGYISSHDCERADDDELAAIAEKIRNA